MAKSKKNRKAKRKAIRARLRDVTTDLRNEERALRELERLRASVASLPGLLHKSEREWLSERLSAVTLAMAGSTSDRKMMEAGSKGLTAIADEVPTRFSRLTSREQQIVIDWARLAIMEWSTNGRADALALADRARQVPRDEIDLWLAVMTRAFERYGVAPETVASEQAEGVASAAKAHLRHVYAESGMSGAPGLDVAIDGFCDAVSRLGRGIAQVVVDANAPKHSAKPGRAATRHYLRILRQIRESMDEPDSIRVLDDKKTQEQGSVFVRRIWTAMQSARVFEVSTKTYEEITDEVGRYVWEDVCEMGAMTHEERLSVLGSPKEVEMWETIRKAGADMPLFEDFKLFDAVFVGLDGEGHTIPPSLAHMKLETVPRNMIRCRLIGIYVGPCFTPGSSDVIEFYRVTAPGDDYIVPVTEFFGAGITFEHADGIEHIEAVGEPVWYNPNNLSPWIVNSVLSFIWAQRNQVAEFRPGLDVRKDYKRLSKGSNVHVIPKPYYVVTSRQGARRAARRAVGKVRQRRPLTHRHDRSAGLRRLVSRGPLPLDERQRRALIKKGYEVWTLDEPHEEAQGHLRARGHAPKRRDEWLALKVVNVRSTIVGDPSLPYVPAVRAVEE